MDLRIRMCLHLDMNAHMEKHTDMIRMRELMDLRIRMVLSLDTRERTERHTDMILMNEHMEEHTDTIRTRELMDVLTRWTKKETGRNPIIRSLRKHGRKMMENMDQNTNQRRNMHQKTTNIIHQRMNQKITKMNLQKMTMRQ